MGDEGPFVVRKETAGIDNMSRLHGNRDYDPF
jgi:hypothetical protein